MLIGMDSEFQSMKPSERKELVEICLGDTWGDPAMSHIKWFVTLRGITSYNVYTPGSAGLHVAWSGLDLIDGSLVILSTGKRFNIN